VYKPGQALDTTAREADEAAAAGALGKRHAVMRFQAVGIICRSSRSGSGATEF